jgi:hypothetical protein
MYYLKKISKEHGWVAAGGSRGGCWTGVNQARSHRVITWYEARSGGGGGGRGGGGRRHHGRAGGF